MKRLLLAASVLVGLLLVPTAVLAVDYATVTGYAEGSSDNNHAETWETGDLECEKTAEDADLGETYVLDQDWDLVIVKAGSDVSTDEHANTLFADASDGETVWADSNGSGAYDEGDKQISHIIFCEGPSDPTPTPVEPTPTPVEPTPTPVEPTPTPEGPTPTPGEPTPTASATSTLPNTDMTDTGSTGGSNPLLLFAILGLVGAAGIAVLKFRVR